MKFAEIQWSWYVFPFGERSPQAPKKHVASFKTARNKVREAAVAKGGWRDNRDTLIPGLAGSDAGDQTIMDIAGHIAKRRFKHYGHIRMEAKHNALRSSPRGFTNAGTGKRPSLNNVQN